MMRNEFTWESAENEESHDYLYPSVRRELELLGKGVRVLDLGCGNGALTARLAEDGFDVTGIDASRSGIEKAKETFPHVRFFQHDINDPIPDDLKGSFDVVLSLEVIEHLFFPRNLFIRAREALGSGKGVLILSTPYHGYLKNLALALLNKFDEHWHPNQDFGHIKFFSLKTLTELVREMGFDVFRVHRVGRLFPWLAKSMIFVCRASNAGK